MKHLFLAGALVALFASPAISPAGAAVVQTTPGPAVTRDLLIGRWTDTNDCNNSVEFMADGRFRTTDGAQGRWELVGRRITFHGNRSLSADVRATDRNTIVLTHDNGSIGTSTRCGVTAARRIPVPALPATEAEAWRISQPAQRSLLIGRWTDDGDCGNTIVFNNDGSFTTSAGGGRWTLEGDRLSFIAERTLTARLRAVGNDRIILLHTDGSLGQSLRC